MYPAEASSSQETNIPRWFMAGWPKIALFWLAAALVIAARRPGQILAPELWLEEGTLVLPEFLRHGWTYIFYPLNGYLVIPSKIIMYISLRISFLYYPEVSNVLGTLAQAACVTAVAFFPTLLPARLVCAIAILLVPSDSEVFVLPQYTFWWTSLLLFLSLLWREGASAGWRGASAFIGGVSSPLVVLLAPLFVAVAMVRRTGSAIAAAVVAVATAALQLAFLLQPRTGSDADLSVLGLIRATATLLGSFALPKDSAFGLIVGAAVAALLVAGIRLLPRADRLPFLLLGLALGAAVASSVARVPLDVMHPFHAGPRYFFFPFVLFSWMLIWMMLRLPVEYKAAAAVCFAGALLNVLPYFQRHQQHLVPWRQQVAECLSAPTTKFEIQYDGSLARAWQSEFTREMCAAGIAGSPIDKALFENRPAPAS